MIRRDLESAASVQHDLVVVGGGIYGAFVALEAARSGYRPLLLDRSDFGGLTTWSNLRIVHGGLRYLQMFDLRRFRESVRERRWFLTQFPDLVHPLPCLMPLYGRGLRRPTVLRLALLLNDALSFDRNRGLEGDRQLAPGSVVSARDTISLFPEVAREGLRGGARWSDAEMSSPQRVLMETLHWACATGATCLNYVEASDLLERDGGVIGVRAIDRATGRSVDFAAPVVVNSAGPWSRIVARDFDRDVPHLFRPTVAFNLLLDRPPLSDVAVAIAASRGDGTYFLRPWGDRIFAGTCHTMANPPMGHELGEGAPEPSSELIEGFLSELMHSVPALEVGLDDVVRVYAGFVPSTKSGKLARGEVLYDHGSAGGPKGLFSLAGAKFTTARLAADRLLSLAYGVDRKVPRGASGEGRAPSPPELSAQEFEDLLEHEPAAAAAHVRRIAEEESILYVEDLLLRRTDWGADPRQMAALAPRVAPLIDSSLPSSTGPQRSGDAS
jgi:glycerol-3-phosphate dehydrogenase